MPAQEGGLKGFFYRAGASFYSGGIYVKEKSYMLASIAGKVGFVVATTSIAVLMPLIFEIMREGQVRASDTSSCSRDIILTSRAFACHHTQS
jgi:hypothetical protein